MTGFLRLIMIGCAILALAAFYGAGSARRKRHHLSFAFALLVGLLLLSLTTLFATITVGISGYRAFTAEQVAATIKTEPIGPHHFRATVILADSSLHMFDLAGDAVYVDAHVLKWRPVGTLLGLQTAYELDRIAGRYQELGDEQSQPRTVFSLATKKRFDAFDLATRYWVLRPLVDAQYGSATFFGATPERGGGTYEVRVSTSGLLVRPSRAR
ncbi:MAG TPA: hypothetical protein VIV83_03365 [Gemmatimonadales bacterium]|jgi:hypothetical protein